jgi:hypothetical protein
MEYSFYSMDDMLWGYNDLTSIQFYIWNYHLNVSERVEESRMCLEISMPYKSICMSISLTTNATVPFECRENIPIWGGDIPEDIQNWICVLCLS